MKNAELSLRDIDTLFNPFNHRKLKLRTRLVMAPVPRLLSRNGIPTAEMERYYRRRAENMVGLIITEPVAINDAAAAADSGMARFYGGGALRAWKGICRAVHACSCCIAPQLNHVGMLRPQKGDMPAPEAPAIGPSGIDPVTGERRGETMSRERIRSVLDAYADAARAARLLGFDAVEINGAAGGLVEQFLHSETNRRSDEYGGDVLGRARFASQILQSVRKSVGRSFPIIFRLSLHENSVWKKPLLESPAELESLLNLLCDSGADFFACDGMGLPAFAGSPQPLASWIRMLTRKPVIVNGGIGLHGISGADLLRYLRATPVELVAVGRALLADAEWGLKIHMGRENDIIPYTPRAWMHLY